MVEINAGFLPLTDSAILVAAKERGFAQEEGIKLNLVRETSWANVRDRLAVGQFDVSHALAPMPIASNLGLTPFNMRLIAPFALGLGGNAITLSNPLMAALSAPIDALDARAAGAALAHYIKEQRGAAHKPLQFAVVHPHSGHNLELRYWLTASGIEVDRDIEIVILPPSLMPDALASGQIDGFCVGEPWNSVAIAQGSGQIITTKSAIWASSPEKVLAVQEEWALNNEESLQALIRALYRAASWCGAKENHAALAELLSQPHYLNVPHDYILPALTGSIVNDTSFFIPHARAATFPWQSHALWFYAQMVRAGHLTHNDENIDIVRRSYRPDLYRAALEPLGVAVPSANAKLEGALKEAIAVGVSKDALFLGPDTFFDGALFDPDHFEITS